MANISIDELKANAETGKIDSKAGLKQDPLEAALERDEEEKKKKEEESIAAYNELKARDGREWEYEVNGMNIGDSIMRRAKTLDENASLISKQIEDEDMDKEIGETQEETKEVEEAADEAVEEDFNFDNEEDIDLDVEEAAAEEPVIEEPKKIVPIAEAKKEKELEKKITNEDLPSQSDLNIDDEDLLDIDLEDDEADSTDADSEKDMDILRDQIKLKLTSISDKHDGIVVSKEAIGLSSVLKDLENEIGTVDWPLMSAGVNVTMKAFTGTEIESLNRGSSGRSRFNTLKDIYRVMYDHIVSEKPDFEEWLKTMSFMDIDHLHAAIYKASFDLANYIPYSCSNDGCNHIFLSDNIDIMSMVKFKDDAAKKRFYDILENSDKMTKKQSSLYPTTIIPITSKIAIGFREPSIYNTIFENSILDQKFIDKYTRLLTMMVYIDGIYYIKDGKYIPISYKIDKQSLAKTAKYRIATYAKIIKALPSDGYTKITTILAEINDLGDSVQYVIPEYTCPKCKQTIPEEIKPCSQLLFSRHQLNLLSQQ